MYKPLGSVLFYLYWREQKELKSRGGGGLMDNNFSSFFGDLFIILDR